jgi:hypothetical protein
LANNLLADSAGTMPAMARNRTPCETLKTPIWKRQPRETSVSYNGFRTYRDLGPTRTLRATAKELGW